MTSGSTKASSSSLENGSSLSEPLLVDTGVVVQVTQSQKHTSSTAPPSPDVIRSLVRFTTLLGLGIGMVAPFVTIDITLLIAYGCAKLDVGLPTRKQLFLVLDLLWGILVILMAVSAPRLFRGIIFKYFEIPKNIPESLVELMELRMALGTLVGVLISGVGMCLYVDCGLWEYAGLVFGGCVVLSYCGSRSIQFRIEDYQELWNKQEKEEPRGIIVV